MLKAVIREMMTYNYAMYRQLWESIEHLTDAQYIEPVAYSTGSVHQHMVHVMSTDRRWMARARQQSVPDRINPDDFPNREIMQSYWQTFETDMLLAVGTLDEAALSDVIDYTVRRHDGNTYHHRSAVWQILLHMVNHGTEHRVQVLRLLHDFGAPTFEQDYMIYLWNK